MTGREKPETTDVAYPSTNTWMHQYRQHTHTHTHTHIHTHTHTHTHKKKKKRKAVEEEKGTTIQTTKNTFVCVLTKKYTAACTRASLLKMNSTLHRRS